MTNTEQIDKILSEVNELEEKEKILFYHKMDEFFDDLNDQQDDDIPIESVFGLWKDRDTTKETLWEKAWTKN